MGLLEGLTRLARRKLGLELKRVADALAAERDAYLRQRDEAIGGT
jgi:hypothetical protein